MGNPVNHICFTSVQDAACSLKFIDDLDLLNRCLECELRNRNRSTMVRNIQARIRQVEKMKKGV